MIIINTGDGKGKTTAAVGQIIRSLGHGNKVCLIQLFKGDDFYGEQKILAGIKGLDFFSFAKEHPFCIKGITLEDAKRNCVFAVEKLSELASSPGKYDLLVLEEFNIALRDGFIDKSLFIELVLKLSEKSDIIITGRGAPKELIDISDIVTEMKEIKHHYKNGIKAKKGIEF